METSQLLLQFLLPPLLFCLALSAPAAADTPSARRPGCQTRCGDVDIPYPFGLSRECAIHTGFELNCSTVNGTTMALNGQSEVTKISVPNAKAWMKTGISSQCDPGTTGNISTTVWTVTLTDSPFRISDTDNKVIVIGCNALAYMIGDSYVIGCVSTCDKNNQKNGSCSSSGSGCCQAVIPPSVRYFQAQFNENYTSTGGCNYMVVMEQAAFNYSTTYNTRTVFQDEYKGQVPVVMDWVITRQPCDEAKTNMTSYACVSDNSECVYSTNGEGYRCSCSRGYEGNPYVAGGCTDIDECLDSTTYPCSGICTNTLGNFTCACPQGQHIINGLCIKDQKSSWWVMPTVVGASVGFVVLVIIITCAYLIQARRKLHHIRRKYFRQHGGFLLFEEMKSQQGVAFKIFSEEELQQATNKFDEQGVLGHGGHGTVYQGILKNNLEVAVKRCVTIDEQQKKEFGKEMLILSQINHKNIVKLLGCCLEVEVPILVYEFIPNGTLFHLIHGNQARHITLSTRLRIAHESAEALAYLHFSASPPIIHGDVKSSNILLDRDYTAKVSDFGASILAPTDESQFVTLVQGTCGYLDPEYMQTCELTDKSDVYSFGVVLLELLTGKKAFNLEGPENEKSLSLRFLSAMKEGRLEDILDRQIKNQEHIEFLEEVAELARHCLEMCGVNRPSMRDVAEKLDRLRKVMKHPWAQKNPEEMESLLGDGEPSMGASSEIVSGTGNFSIEKNAIIGLKSGR